MLVNKAKTLRLHFDKLSVNAQGELGKGELFSFFVLMVFFGGMHVFKIGE
jgi:hypothetical protein